MLGIIIPIDFHIFQRGGPTTNQIDIFNNSRCPGARLWTLHDGRFARSLPGGGVLAAVAVSSAGAARMATATRRGLVKIFGIVPRGFSGRYVSGIPRAGWFPWENHGKSPSFEMDDWGYPHDETESSLNELVKGKLLTGNHRFSHWRWGLNQFQFSLKPI